MNEQFEGAARRHEIPDVSIAGARIVVVLTALLGAYIVGVSVWALTNVDKADKELFETVVVHALIPIFNSLLVAVLTWVFGKQLVGALVARIVR